MDRSRFIVVKTAIAVFMATLFFSEILPHLRITETGEAESGSGGDQPGEE